MARLPRLSVAQLAHLVLLRGHNGQPVFLDDADRRAFINALKVAFDAEHVALHAYALLPERVWLLCTPRQEPSLSRAMQALGRRFSAAFNRRHGRSGSLWDGRFRSTVIEPGAAVLDAMVFVDQLLQPALAEQGDEPAAAPWCSARQHLGLDGETAVSDPAEYWALGNTPFDRAAAYRARWCERGSGAVAERMARAAHAGWALGSPQFIAELQARIARPVAPRVRGRPRQRPRGAPPADTPHQDEVDVSPI